MENLLEESDMPPLTLEMHKKLRAFEHGLRLALGECSGSHSLHDPEAAFEYARTYAVKFYDCFFDFYSQIPDPSYKPHWSPASERFSLQRVVRCLQNDYNVEQFFKNNPDRTTRIKKTIAEHAKKANVDFSILTGKQSASYARAGIDVASASPLLKMALTPQMSPPSAYKPLLPLVITPPKPKRLSAHITNSTAARKMQEFMDSHCLNQTEFAIQANTSDKTIRKFRRTGQIKRSIVPDIAKAMGITKEELLRQ